MPNIEKIIQNTEEKQLKEVKKEEEKYKVVNWYPYNYISHSSLRAFETCPISFYLRYYSGVKFPQNKNMLNGLAFQEALNLKHQGKDYSSEIQKVDNPVLAEKLIKQTDKYPVDKVISLDKEYIVDFGLDLPVKFVPDLLATGVVREHKYSGGYYNSTMVKKEKQGTIYYFGVYKQFGWYPKIQYFVYNKKTGKLTVTEVEKTEEDIKETVMWMKDTLQRIKECYNNKLWATSSHGRFCDLKEACPIR